MKNALLLHGTSNDRTRNWLPWLEKKLEDKGYTVWVPNLPNADRPNIERYNKYIFSNWKFDTDSVIVGHSSGAVEVLGLLDSLPDNIVLKKAILVAGFTTDLNYDAVREMFVTPFDYRKIKKKAEKFIFFHSDNDPYVPLWHGEKLRDELGGELIILKGQAHFSTTTYPGDKYLEFPELLEKILWN